MSPLAVVVFASDSTPAALDSLSGQADGAQVLVVGDVAGSPEVAKAAEAAGAQVVQTPAGACLGEQRNAALELVDRDLVLLIDPGETVARDALPRHVEALSGDESLVASYGRTAIQLSGRVRVRPDHGRGGTVTRRLLKQKQLIASSASMAWRRAALDGEFPGYTSAAALRLDLGLRLSKQGAFTFHAAVVAERQTERPDLVGLEEHVKVLVGVLYSGETLEERLEQRARFRLARHLVAMGKIHYRKGDHARAQKFLDEAVKAAPGYFRGRRYQFLNFVKNTISRTK